jgi:enoyl-CoA hydratase/carnithine racemase
MAKAAEVELKIEHRVARLTISDEKRMNLLNTPTMERIIRAGEELRRNDTVGLVILSGGGDKAFIGGADITELAELNPESALHFITRVHQVCNLFRALPVPTIARVNGYCLGAGMEVAASCDLRIGAAHSMYGMPEVQVGLPSVVEAVMLPSLIGWGKTREILYMGTMIDAQEAHRIGFLEKLAPADEMDAAMQPWVEAILAADPAAIRAQKRLIETWLDSGVATGIQASIDAFSLAFHSSAPNDRLQAFINRPRGKK